MSVLNSDRSRPRGLTWLWIGVALSVAGFDPAFAVDSRTLESSAEAATLYGQPREVYRSRRETLMRGVREANQAQQGRTARTPVIVLRGADDPDLEGRFRQSSEFAYLTGVDIPSAVLVLYPAEDREILYLPPADPNGGYFNEARPGPSPETAARYGLGEVRSSGQLLGDLFTALDDPSITGQGPARAVVHVRTPEVKNPPRGPEEALIALLKQGAPRTEFRDIRPEIAALRVIKSEPEIALLKRAIAITTAAFGEMVAALEPGSNEYELQGVLLGSFLRQGAQREGFPAIVGSGSNATIPHYFGRTDTADANELVIADIGAEYNLYTADLTRTFPASGTFTPRQREIYQLVLDAQRAVEAAVKPGETRLGDLTAFTREFFQASPLRARDAEGKERSMEHFFVHGLGHYLGLDVHDVGDSRLPLQPGMVFTIEPGLYIKSEGIGVRIEDDYLVTATGVEKLSADLPSAPAAIERWMAGAKEGEPGEGPLGAPTGPQP